MAGLPYGSDEFGGAADAYVTALAGVAIFGVQRYSQRLLFMPLARRMGLHLKGEEVAKKFAYECWCLVWHTAMLVWELAAVAGEPWFHASLSPWTAPGGTLTFWDPNARMSATLRYLYLTQLGYTLYDLVYLYFFDKDKKGFIMFVSHHIAAMLLILTSYFPPPCRFVFIGSAILLFHEVSDVFLYAAKLARFAEFKVATPVLFILATLSWGWLRVVNFPRIIWSAAFESHESSTRQQACVAMLSVLFVLHVDWFRQLLEVLWRAISGRGLDDPHRPDVDFSKEKQDSKKGR